MSETCDCQQCGHESDDFVDGVCRDCWEQNEFEHNEFLAALDIWDQLTDAQRDARIKWASEHGWANDG